MAELITLRVQRSDIADPKNNREQLWHTGYVIVVRENNGGWARKERRQEWLSQGLPDGEWHGQTQLFFIPAAPAADYLHLLLPQNELDDGTPVFFDPDGNMSTTDFGLGPYPFRRRIWMIKETIPAAIEDELNATGEVIINPPAKFNALIQKSNLGEGAT